LRVLIAGGGIGGLSLASVLLKNPMMKVTVMEQASEFKRFGGPIQLASNALHTLSQWIAKCTNRLMRSSPLPEIR
jgi:zeaxanthin epoxidase